MSRGACLRFDMLKRLYASAVWLFAAFCLGSALITPAAAQKISLMVGTDLPGFDYSILKDVDLDTCQSACKDDRICRAFTFNEQSKWCFLKSDVGPETSFEKA